MCHRLPMIFHRWVSCNIGGQNLEHLITKPSTVALATDTGLSRPFALEKSRKRGVINQAGFETNVAPFTPNRCVKYEPICRACQSRTMR
jgi:hypothetical protein